MKRSACITFESNSACQHSTDGSDPARMKWLVEENSKGTRWEWVAERSSLLGCENGHLHRGGPAPHLSPASTTERLTGRQCTVKQKNTGRRRGQSAKQCSLTKSSSVPPCGANWTTSSTPPPPSPSKRKKKSHHHPLICPWHHCCFICTLPLKQKISQHCLRGNIYTPLNT